MVKFFVYTVCIFIAFIVALVLLVPSDLDAKLPSNAANVAELGNGWWQFELADRKYLVHTDSHSPTAITELFDYSRLPVAPPDRRRPRDRDDD